ncbi:MAG: LamG-like jellyroll fold domain-containing protein [Maioricimonas sp. JB049]
MNTHRIEELESLLLAWEDGTLDEEGIAQLRAILRSDEAARSHFVQMQMLTAAMQLEGDAGLSLPPLDGLRSDTASQATSHARSRDRARRPYRLAAIVAGLLVCLLGGRLAWLEFGADTVIPGEAVATPDRRPAVSDKEPTARGIARVTKLVDVEGADQQSRVEVGDALTPGTFAIRSGFAQIEFFCGATVILEGPAEINVESPMLATVLKGRLRAHVPPAARGFSLDVGDMKVVDLGTEFGLSVSPEGADVQVFDGEVEVQNRSDERRRVTAGRGLIRKPGGELEETAATAEQFVDFADLEVRSRNQQNSRYARWQAWSETIRSDPRLIACYMFDVPHSRRRVLESSLVPINSELDGAIVGARRVEGRWDRKGALEFKRPGDQVRVQIPGEYGSLTFACWARIDSLDRWYNSLFLTDGYEQGEPHWQIRESGEMHFSIRAHERKTNKPPHRVVHSRPFWEPSMSGRWIHLATVFDIETGRVSHYLNGRLLDRGTIPKNLIPESTRIGTASIGNWSVPTRPDASFAIRNLNGSIDEFLLFAAALTDDEIRDIYEHGKP